MFTKLIGRRFGFGTTKAEFTTLLLFSCSCILAQRETDQWFFGNMAALNFSSGTPVSVSGSSMQAVEACASLADNSGTLLFYTNGVDIWNRNHQVMANGSAINGNISSTQVLAVRQPGSNQVYYVFSVPEYGQGSLSYTKIDMALASGNGSVVVKNHILEPSMSEKICGTMHCNSTDVWVLTHKVNSDGFYAYLVSSSGVNTVAVVSNAGSVHTRTSVPTGVSAVGSMKFSPTGRKVGLVFSSDPAPEMIAEILDFDPSTGQVNNGFTLDTLMGYGCEFSPDGSKFYASEIVYPSQVPKVHQWDLCAGSQASIRNSKQTVAFPTEPYGFRGVQLARDGKIYIATGSTTIAAIADPNKSGTSCNFQSQAVLLKHGYCNWGLPNFISSPFRQTASINKTIQTCGAANFSVVPYNYCMGVSYSIQSVAWNFGDPSSNSANTSTLSVPQHTYSKNGIYPVKLVTHYQCYTDTVIDTVVITDYPNLQVSGRAMICANESTTLLATGAPTLQWSSGQNIANLILSPSSSTVLSVTGTGTNGCQSVLQVSLTVDPCQLVNEASRKYLRVYPNPAEDVLNIEGKAGTELILYDLSGKEVDRFRLKEETGIWPIWNLSPGLYFLRVYGESGGRTLLKN